VVKICTLCCRSNLFLKPGKNKNTCYNDKVGTKITSLFLMASSQKSLISALAKSDWILSAEAFSPVDWLCHHPPPLPSWPFPACSALLLMVKALCMTLVTSFPHIINRASIFAILAYFSPSFHTFACTILVLFPWSFATSDTSAWCFPFWSGGPL
jgi:hypothetical protein